MQKWNVQNMSRREYTEILEDQLTLSEPGGADYAHHISTPDFQTCGSTTIFLYYIISF